jgi:hypothetical protein
MTNRISGGASFPANFGTVTVSWPLAVLTMTDEGVSVDIQPKFLKRVNRRLIKSATSSSSWSARWTELASVEYAKRDAVFHVEGKFGCRFMAVTRKRLVPILEELENRGVAAMGVRSTRKWYFKPS